MPEMAASEVVAIRDLDVTIFLMEKSTTEDPAGSTSNKRRRKSKDPSQVAHGKQVGQVKVKASRLRQCSTYFGTCMREGWAQSKVTKEMKFHLEVHTKVSYYEDCFSRMNYLYKPIRCVACCIELLKVASQIGFQAVMDIGVKYLGAKAWSDEEEKLVREYFSSANLVSFDSLTDLLSARFHYLPLAREEQQEKLSLNAKNLLSRYFRSALPEESLLGEAARASQNCSRSRFAMTFHVVMSAVESGTVCDEVLEHIQALQTIALANLLTRVQRELNDLPARASAVEGVLSDMSWLFEVAREANAAQALVVQLLGKDLCIVRRLYSAIFKGDPRPLKVWHLKQWAKIIYALFEDVQEGKLFLNSLQRATLFDQWGWLVDNMFLSVDGELLLAIHVKFVTTLPQMEQEKFWMKLCITPESGILWEAYRNWISRMVTGKAHVMQQQPTAQSNEVSSKSEHDGLV